MKNDNIEPQDPENDEWQGDEEEEIDMVRIDGATLLGKVFDDILKTPKPFGIVWDEEHIIRFLKQRGYKILNRHNAEDDYDYKVAVKSGEVKVDDSGYSNLRSVFSSEIQDILSDWLLGLGGSKE